MNGTLVFPGREEHGCELWRSDGVTAELLMDINPGPANSMWPGKTTPFRRVGNLVVFSADDGVSGLELWATDGASTTRLVQDIALGAGWSSPRFFTPAGHLVYFTADNPLSGAELWAIPKSTLRASLRLSDTGDSDLDDDPPPAPRARANEFRAFLPAVGDELPDSDVVPR